MISKKLKIGFRVEASNTIGTGHLAEILSLADSLRDKLSFEPIFLINRNKFIEQKCKNIGNAKIRYVQSNIPQAHEVESIISILEREECNHLVIDLLNRSNDFYGHLNRKLQTICVILDNDKHDIIEATIVVNFSICQDPNFYKRAKDSGTRYLIGPRYFPMDQRLKNISPIRIKEKVECIFINQGGSDPYGITEGIVKEFEKLPGSLKANVVCGGQLSEKHKRRLKKLKAFETKSRLHENILPQQLYDIVKMSDIAISAAGNTLYELAYLGVPTLVLSHHKEHDKVADSFARKGAVMNLGIGSRLSISGIPGAVRELMSNYDKRHSLSENMKRIVKGEGTAILARELVEIYKS